MHPLASVPHTLYNPLSETVMLAVIAPVLHEYAVPVLAVSVVKLFMQIELSPETNATAGETFTVTVSVLLHPPEVTVTI